MTKIDVITGGQVLVAALRASGIDRVFCVPGESYLAALDALYNAPDIDVVTCRHEGGAALMAVADARLTGRPSVCMVSRGPGAANACLGVHVAQQDAAPVVFIIGQVERRNLGRGAFQEVDYGKTFSDMAKWTAEIHDPARIAEHVARAMQEAQAGVPGPVVLSFPEDVLEAETSAQPAMPVARTVLHPAPEAVRRLAAMLASSERPVVLAGGQCEPADVRSALRTFSERWNVPVAATNKRQCVFDNAHPNWIGHIGFIVPNDLAAVLYKADLIIALGTRLGDVSSQRYTFPLAPQPTQPLVHIYPDAATVVRNFRADLPVAADVGPVLEALNRIEPEGDAKRSTWIADLGRARDALSNYLPMHTSDGIDFGWIALELGRQLQGDAIVTLDAGNFVSWIHAYTRFRASQEMLGAVGGSMGLGVPAAVAASLRFPERQVVAVVGDGGFMMTGNELATAIAKGARPKIIVADNGSYGVIRAHQEAAYPGRVIATRLTNPDFAMLAVAHGAIGLSIENTVDVGPVISEMLAADRPVVVKVKTSLKKINAYKYSEEFE